MSIRVTVVDAQSVATVSRAEIRRAVAALMAKRRSADDHAWSRVDVILVDDQGSAKLHAQLMQDPTPTDVITQAFHPHPGGDAAWSAELYVNVERALQVGHSRLGGPARELLLYIAHGCDHLLGGRDDSPRERRAMLARESRWIRALSKPKIRLRADRT